MWLKSKNDFDRFEHQLLIANGNLGVFSDTLNDPRNSMYFDEFASVLAAGNLDQGNPENRIIVTNPELAEKLYQKWADSVYYFAEEAFTPEIRQSEEKRMQEWLGQIKNTNLNSVDGALEAIGVNMPFYKLPQEMQAEKAVILKAVVKQEQGDRNELLCRLPHKLFDAEISNKFLDWHGEYLGRAHNYLFDNPTFATAAEKKGYKRKEPEKGQNIFDGFAKIRGSVGYVAKNALREIGTGIVKRGGNAVDFINEKLPMWNRIHANIKDKRAFRVNIKRLSEGTYHMLNFANCRAIAESVITGKGAYAGLKGTIDMKKLLTRMYESAFGEQKEAYEQFMERHKSAVFAVYGIRHGEFAEQAVAKYGFGILKSGNSELYSQKARDLIGAKNVDILLKYVEAPKLKFKLNDALEKTSLENIVDTYKKLGGSMEKFNENLFRVVTDRFNSNKEVMTEFLGRDNLSPAERSNMQIFMKLNLKGYEEVKNVGGLADLTDTWASRMKEKTLIGTERAKVQACKNIICALKYGCDYAGFDFDRKELRDTISYYLKHHIDSKKLGEIEKAIGREAVGEFKPVVAEWERINEMTDLAQLTQMAEKTMADFKSGNLHSGLNLFTMEKDIRGLYGQELKASLTNLDAIKDRSIDEVSGVKVLQLNGEDFSILNHTLNAYGGGGTVADFDGRERGKSYLCTSLVTNYNMGHADRGENNAEVVKLGFVEISPDQFAMSAPRDVFSQGKDNSRFLTSKGGMDYMTSSETSKRTIYIHNEFVIYREAANGDKIKPNCVLCFSPEVNDAHRQAAQELGGPDLSVPIVKVNVPEYKRLHRERIIAQEGAAVRNPTPENVKEYLYSLTSYTSGYAWETGNTPKGDEFLTKEGIGDRVENVLQAIKSAHGENPEMRATCAESVEKFIDDCTLMRDSHYEFMKTKRGETMRVKEGIADRGGERGQATLHGTMAEIRHQKEIAPAPGHAVSAPQQVVDGAVKAAGAKLNLGKAL
ncbi:MAG: hypothetical protein LBL34_02650 [Clostridiales bacterium]|jgi:hypothetical protein|nr:hypothetical protein [Clostridiales bacterium]